MNWLVPRKSALALDQRQSKPTVDADAFSRKLASFRKATGTPERFVTACACARHDRSFLVVYERFDPLQPFRIVSIMKSVGAADGCLAATPQSVDIAHIDSSGWRCPWCGDASGLVACSGCNAFVCRGRTTSQGGQERFTCRDSCGVTGGSLEPLTRMQGASGQNQRTFAKTPSLPSVASVARPALPRTPSAPPLLKGPRP